MAHADDDVSKPKVTVAKPVYLPFIAKADTPAEPPGKEVRALWISRFDLGSPPLKRARLMELINRAADAGFNVILLQVRATSDAYYSPGLEPWSYRLTSSRIEDLGRDPGWDPLKAAIETAHVRGLELHAYVNAFSVWECGRGAPPHTTPEHAYWKLANYKADNLLYDPTWRVYAKVNGQTTPMGDAKTDPVACYEYLWASAGVERVHNQNLAVLKDIAARYAVDGIHLDRVRYPGRQYSYDPETVAAWQGTVPPVTFENWQRDNLSRWMARYTSEVKAIRPDVTMSAAVWFTYKKTAAITFPTSQGYYDYYQDSHRWLTEGVVDAIAPMIYGTTFNEDINKWKILADDHVSVQGARQAGPDLPGFGNLGGLSAVGGQVWLGLGADLPDFGLIAERIDYARLRGARGVAIWSAGALDAKGYWDDLKAGPFRDPAVAR